MLFLLLLFAAWLLTLEAVLPIEYHHTPPAGAQMGVIVDAKENVQNDVAPGNGAKKSAHYAKNSSERAMGSI